MCEAGQGIRKLSFGLKGRPNDSRGFLTSDYRTVTFNGSPLKTFGDDKKWRSAIPFDYAQDKLGVK